MSQATEAQPQTMEQIIARHQYNAFARDLMARHRCHASNRRLKKIETERMIAEARYAIMQELTQALEEAGYTIPK